MARRLAFAIFPQFQLMDVAGPIAAFDFANLMVPGSYRLELCAPGAGAVQSSSGAAIVAKAFDTGPFDTILVSGGYGLANADTMKAVAEWLRREAPATRRVASVCVGSYALAEAGLLDGLMGTTHWGWVDDFTRRYPNVVCKRDIVYLNNGKYWTSAGISAGIEMALALIEDDLGPDAARSIVHEMFVHTRGADGHVAPSWLQANGVASRRFDELLMWMRMNLRDPMRVEALAEKMRMSPRNFARVFREETGLTPAKAVERMRLEAAQSLLAGGAWSNDQVAASVGFGSAERMRRAFHRSTGTAPGAVRRAARTLCLNEDPLRCPSEAGSISM